MSRSIWTAGIGTVLLATCSTAALAAPAAAAAAPGLVSVISATNVAYRAAQHTTNKVVITRSGNTIVIDDQVAIKAGTGCRGVAGDSTKVLCTTVKPPVWVVVDAYDGNDSIVNHADVSSILDGGDGNDVIIGGPKPDQLIGGNGNDHIWGAGGGDAIRDGAGNDVVYGGDGNDWFWGDYGNDLLYGQNGDDEFFMEEPYKTAATPDADFLSGGAGFDTADYGSYYDGVYLSINGKADDGIAGEHDNIGGDIEELVGGIANDHLYGSDRDEYFFAGPGNDAIWGGGGDDVIQGQQGTDWMNGGPGDDSIDGGDFDNDTTERDYIDGGTNGTRGDYCYPTKYDVVGACEHVTYQ